MKIKQTERKTDKSIDTQGKEERKTERKIKNVQTNRGTTYC